MSTLLVLLGVVVAAAVLAVRDAYRAGKQRGYTDAMRERLDLDSDDWSLYDGKRWRKL